jgi:hypothetical protein
MALRDRILQDFADTRDIADSLLEMPEKDLWKFILTGGFDTMDIALMPSLLMHLTLRLRAALSKDDKYEIQMPTDEEIAEGYGVTVEEIREFRKRCREER